ncbi:Usb1 [Symbiodinium sp. CCMP2456]|nr:Usb1 [Symbiodinium sp. CCMP2456]
MAAETGTAEGSRRPRRFTFSDEAPAPQSAPAPSASSTAIPPRQGFSAATPPPSYGGFSQQPRPAPAVHPPAGWPQQNWGTAPAAGWGAGAGAGLAGAGDGWGGDAWAGGWGPGDGWAGWGQGAWGKGGGGAGAFGGPPMFGTVLIGTVKSYSAVKGFGFLIHPDIPQDIWFAKETVAAELRTSDLAGTAMAFELMRAPDGKPQARNLRPAPAGAGMPPPPVNPNHHPHAMPGFRPGMPGLPGLAGCPGLVRPGFPGAVRPLGAMGVGVGVPLGGCGQPKRRAWSPHAGSRAIATASLEEGQDSSDGPSQKRRRLSVPSSLQGLFERAEEPEDHGGRKRRVPHVEGNYPTLVFIPVTMTRAWRRTGDRCKALLSRLAPQADVLSTDPEVGAGWHVSLAPLMMLRRQSIQPFEERLRKLAEGLSMPDGVQEDIWFNETLEVFSSAEGDRYFAGVSAVSTSQRWLRPLAAAVTSAARDLGVSVATHSADLLQLHCSLAWTTSELRPALSAAGAEMQESPWGRRWILQDGAGVPLKLRVKGLCARIGDRTSSAAFTQLKGGSSEDEESLSGSGDDHDQTLT